MTFTVMDIGLASIYTHTIALSLHLSFNHSLALFYTTLSLPLALSFFSTRVFPFSLIHPPPPLFALGTALLLVEALN